MTAEDREEAAQVLELEAERLEARAHNLWTQRQWDRSRKLDHEADRLRNGAAYLRQQPVDAPTPNPDRMARECQELRRRAALHDDSAARWTARGELSPAEGHRRLAQQLRDRAAQLSADRDALLASQPGRWA